MSTKKVIVISLLVALGVVVVFGSLGVFAPKVQDVPTPSPVAQEVGAGGSVTNNIDTFVNGLQLGDQISTWKTVTIGAGANQASFRNRTGRSIIVDYAEVVTLATTSTALITASSTMRVLVGTSTAATISDFATPTSANSALVAQTIATSTAPGGAATTTNSVLSVARGSYGAALVRDGEYVNFALLNWATGAPNPACVQGGPCESATSTQRGFNLRGSIRYHYQQ